MERKMRQQEEFSLGSIGDEFDLGGAFSEIHEHLDVFGDEGGPSLKTMKKEQQEKRSDAIIGNFLDRFDWG